MTEPTHQQPGENIVIKIGGASLFGGSPLLDPIRKLITPREHERIFVLLGGGETVESMRTLHAHFPQLDAETMHWRCVRLLDSTWEIGCELFPHARRAGTWDELSRSARGPLATTYFVRASAFYSPDSLHRVPAEWLPIHDWDTTTDAISWVLAKLVDAAELRIAKRCSVDPLLSIRQAAASGMIDPELARLVATREPNEKPSIRFVVLEANP